MYPTQSSLVKTRQKKGYKKEKLEVYIINDAANERYDIFWNIEITTLISNYIGNNQA